MQTTKIRVHDRSLPYSDGRTQEVERSKHLLWLYRQFRQDGMKRADARMNLCFAIAYGQRDIRSRINEALRNVG